MCRYVRNCIGVSQAGMARLLGIRRQATISDYETGKENPSGTTIKAYHYVYTLYCQRNKRKGKNMV